MEHIEVQTPKPCLEPFGALKYIYEIFYHTCNPYVKWNFPHLYLMEKVHFQFSGSRNIFHFYEHVCSSCLHDKVYFPILMKKQYHFKLMNKFCSNSTPDRRQLKRLILSMNVDKTHYRVFDCHLSPLGQQMAILSPLGQQMAILKTLFLAILDPNSSIVKSIFNCRLSGV